MQEKLIVITGEKGIGKTSVCRAVCEKAREKGYEVAGIISPPVFNTKGRKIGYKAEKIISEFGNGEKLGLNIEYIIEDKPLGTAGPLKLAKKYLNEPFLMLNGDNLTKVDVADLYKSYTDSEALGAIVLVTVKNPEHYGVVDVQGTKITRFSEKPKKGKASSNLINAGIYVLDPKVIDYIPEKDFSMIEKDVFPKMAKEGNLSAYIYSGPWFDVGNAEGYERTLKNWRS